MDQEISIFSYLGGEQGVYELVQHFYDAMEALPEAHDILVMHPQPLSAAREKLYLFLVGWFGGPPLYIKRYGHPRLRARHLPYQIDSAARDAWMRCMNIALEKKIKDEQVRAQISAAFYRMADFMRNKPDAEPES